MIEMNEFLNVAAENEEAQTAAEPVVENVDLAVQQEVVADLAAEKAEVSEELAEARKELELRAAILKATEAQKFNLERQVKELKADVEAHRAEIRALKTQIAQLETQEFDSQPRNPNSLAILDRDVEVPDRFPGETRDHVIDAIREAKDKAEAEGRLRRAQVLESVLVANEPTGNLQKKRSALEKFLQENHNVLTGPVINELDKYGIKYKDGDKLLLISEIITRTY